MELKIYISGSGYFGAEVLKLCVSKGFEIVGIDTTQKDKRLRAEAENNNVPIYKSVDQAPDFDLGICAHSFKIISDHDIQKARIGWIGYHPSLLPRHRGKSSIEWTIRMRDLITGGTIYWLNSGIDDGEIAYQDFVFVDPELWNMPVREATFRLWTKELCPLGLKLFEKALKDIPRGIIEKEVQDLRFATYEPAIK